MAPSSYKFTYFNGRGLGETARQVFAVAGQKYEDVRIEKEQWEKLKPTTPFGQLPLLEVDGHVIPQSAAIVRFLAKQFGLYGANDFEAALIDAYMDQYKDFHTEFAKYVYILRGMKPGDKDAAWKEHAEPARDSFFPLIVKQLKANGTGFIVGSKLSYFDLHLAENVTTTSKLLPGKLDKYPEVLEFAKRIQEIPQVKAWIEKRPVTDF